MASIAAVAQYPSAMSEWRYRQTSIEPVQQFDKAVNAHLAKMADAGWELVTATSSIRESAHGGSQTCAYHYIWKQPR